MPSFGVSCLCRPGRRHMDQTETQLDINANSHLAADSVPYPADVCLPTGQLVVGKLKETLRCRDERMETERAPATGSPVDLQLSPEQGSRNEDNAQDLPICEARCEDALHRTPVKSSQDSCAEAGIPQLPQEVKASENWNKILDSLKSFCNEDVISCLEHVVGDYKTNSLDPKNLVNLSNALKEQFQPQKLDSDKGEKKSSWWSSWSSQGEPAKKHSTSSPAKKVKVYVQVTGETCGAHETILHELFKIMSTKMEVTDNVEDSYIIMVFCPIRTRVGSDLAAAIGNLPESRSLKPVVLVPMHHTRKADYSVGKKWSEGNPNIVLEVHVLFHETMQGLLICDRNHKAVKQIKEVLKQYSKY